MTGAAAQWRLASIWLAGGAVILLILVGQSLAGFYGARTGDVWSWFLPTVLPTLSLIVGALVSEARAPETAVALRPNPPVFRLAAGLSLLYLMLVVVSVVAAAILGDRERPPLDLLQLSNLWLAPLQGLVAASLGFFFHRQRG